MDSADHIHRVCTSLLALPTWTRKALRLSYSCTDPFIDRLLARKLIRHALLGQRMLRDTEGKLDRVEYTDLDSKHSVTKPWPVTRNVREQ